MPAPGQGVIPNSQEIEKARQMAFKSIEAAQYFTNKLQEVIKKHKLQNLFKEFLANPGQFEKEVKFALDSGANPWSGIGEKPNSSFADNLQRGKANEAAEKIQGIIRDAIVMHAAISDDSKIIRGYAVDNQAIENIETQKELDYLLNGWLAENGIISKDGTLYEKGPDGQVKTDINGKPIEADAGQAKALLKDPEKGLEAYTEKKGIALSIQEHEFPKQPVAEPKEVKKAPEKAPGPEGTTAPEAETSPTTPGSGGGGGT